MSDVHAHHVDGKSILNQGGRNFGLNPTKVFRRVDPKLAHSTIRSWQEGNPDPLWPLTISSDSDSINQAVYLAYTK